jgi:hypothetical protein
MGFNEKMTALADEVRELSGTTEEKSLDDLISDTTSANSEITEQTNLIDQIRQVVDTLPEAEDGSVSGGEGDGSSKIDTCTIIFNNSDLSGGDCYILSLTATVVENGMLKSFYYDTTLGSISDYMISNVVCGTIITLFVKLGYGDSFYQEINGSAVFNFSHIATGGYGECICAFTAPTTADEECTIYYAYE